MRFSACAGLVEVGSQGVTGQAAIRAALLVNNNQLRDALRNAPDRSLAIIIEDKLFEDVVLTRRRGLRPEDYQRTVIRDKYDNDHVAWITVPESARLGGAWPTESDSPHTSLHQPIHNGESTMSDVISVAADALVAFLAAGGGAVAAGAASEAGAELYKPTSSVAAKAGERVIEVAAAGGGAYVLPGLDDTALRALGGIAGQSIQADLAMASLIVSGEDAVAARSTVIAYLRPAAETPSSRSRAFGCLPPIVRSLNWPPSVCAESFAALRAEDENWTGLRRPPQCRADEHGGPGPSRVGSGAQARDVSVGT
jgi:hypothetical protein